MADSSDFTIGQVNSVHPELFSICQQFSFKVQAMLRDPQDWVLVLSVLCDLMITNDPLERYQVGRLENALKELVDALDARRRMLSAEKARLRALPTPPPARNVRS